MGRGITRAKGEDKAANIPDRVPLVADIPGCSPSST